jgi:hypothetical protein
MVLMQKRFVMAKVSYTYDSLCVWLTQGKKRFGGIN